MKNKDLAQIFFEMADIFELMNVDWKPNAYRKAARSLDSMSKSVEEIYKSQGIRGLRSIPGVGEGIAKKIEEFLRTGHVKEYEKLSAKIPKGVEDMMYIPGMGPKTAWKLYKEFRIKSRSELEKAAKAGRLRKIKGFGAKSEEDILKGIELRKKSAKRVLLGDALPVARELVSFLRSAKGVKRVDIAGSIRRMKETIGDIDILVEGESSVIGFFTGLKNVKRVLAKGPTKASVILDEGIQSDLRVLPKRSYGAGLQYFTGSKDHNVELRKIAMRKGYKLSEYGLFKGPKYVCGQTEGEIYRKLGFALVPPELRENVGELSKPLPNLVKYDQVNGDLQMHSKWSDGNNSILDMAKACEKKGYDFMAITDHSKSQRIAGGMDERRLQKYLDEIKKVQKKVGIRILKGCEVDILADGKLDFADRVLEKLDIVLAAVHSGFKQSEKVMTDRICSAIENPHVNILAHPTGRIIGARDPYSVNLERVCEVAKKRKVALEIDSFPSRLDLSDVNARFALGRKCLLSVNTDSHSVDHLNFMELGVGQARRAGAEAKDIINAWPLSKVEKFLRKK